MMSPPSGITDSSSMSMSQYSVIVVDDEPNILKTMQRIFRREQYRIICVDSGAEGLKIISETPSVAVIISDQRMPEMSGSDFLVLSRERAPDAIRMLLTGYSDLSTTITAMNEGGATHFISKPWDDATLIQTVRDGVMQYHLSQVNRRQYEMLERQNEELTCCATTDALTGLANYRRLFEYLEKEHSRTQRYGGSLSLLLFDIDNFKQINDTWGHTAGDAVLRQIARKTSVILRKNDISARYGGDEFVMLLPETKLAEAGLIANRLLKIVSDMVVTQVDGPPISVTISVGAAMIGPDESVNDLIIRADQAMYRAKKSGRNRVEVSDNIQK